MSLTSSVSIMPMRHTEADQDGVGGKTVVLGGWLAGRPPCFIYEWQSSVSMVIASIHRLPISKVAILCRPHGLSNSLICNGQSGSLIETRTRERD